MASGGSLNIATGGTLTLYASPSNGLSSDGSVENNGTLTIGNLPLDGIYIGTAGSFTNKGTVKIGETGDIGRIGISNAGTFVNERGSIAIDRSGEANNAAIMNTASFTNKASIVMGLISTNGSKGSGVELGLFGNFFK